MTKTITPEHIRQIQKTYNGHENKAEKYLQRYQKEHKRIYLHFHEYYLTKAVAVKEVMKILGFDCRYSALAPEDRHYVFKSA